MYIFIAQAKPYINPSAKCVVLWGFVQALLIPQIHTLQCQTDLDHIYVATHRQTDNTMVSYDSVLCDQSLQRVFWWTKQ